MPARSLVGRGLTDSTETGTWDNRRMAEPCASGVVDSRHERTGLGCIGEAVHNRRKNSSLPFLPGWEWSLQSVWRAQWPWDY